jgi:two-component system, NarL family, invasion response regulator UvrY
MKVLIIEDHAIVRDGCKHLFDRRSDIEIAETSSGAAGIALNKALGPDVIVLDVALPDANGVDIITRLLDDNSKAKIVMLSMYGTQSLVTAALEKGAVGYVTKNDDPNAILAAVDKVLAGEMYLGQAIAQNLAMTNLSPGPDPLHDLSERERRIVALLGRGKSLTEISVDLGTSYKTIANAVTAIKQKLEITTTTSLIKFAVELSFRHR